MKPHDYDQEPVFYCTKCLSLKVMDVEGLPGSEFCDKCGSTDIAYANIKDWEEMFYLRYGYYYLDGK